MNKAQSLLDQLIAETKIRIETCEEKLLPLSQEALAYRPNPQQWNVLECLEHLHRYAHYYYPQITKQVHSASVADGVYKESFMGKQFMKMFEPQKAKKYKTLKRMNPISQEINAKAVARFLAEQQQFIELLEKSYKVSLVKTKVPLEFLSWLRLPLGDLLRFLHAHDQRHFEQALRMV